MSSSNSLLLFFSVLFTLIFSLVPVNSDIEVEKPPQPLHPVAPVGKPSAPPQPAPTVKPPSPPTTPLLPPVMPKDVVRIGDRRYVLEHAEHVVSGANVYHPARMETERSVADVTQI
ncbi:unnamed protein product [Brassica rapa]|uniref:Uncharacterized protein n=2 Tax=Brassica TaxID=3705 RepID=A0A3P5XTY6_BRACM|nr:unnamed protein product [Brassica napus]CAG7859880.1 unnamed protein product [Brassica rapa]CDY20028.1 BnaA09g02230D [Brassica napus]VDC58387.1 unnamed protein product [Brassica rapa]